MKNSKYCVIMGSIIRGHHWSSAAWIPLLMCWEELKGKRLTQWLHRFYCPAEETQQSTVLLIIPPTPSFNETEDEADEWQKTVCVFVCVFMHACEWWMHVCDSISSVHVERYWWEWGMLTVMFLSMQNRTTHTHSRACARTHTHTLWQRLCWGKRGNIFAGFLLQHFTSSHLCSTFSLGTT